MYVFSGQDKGRGETLSSSPQVRQPERHGKKRHPLSGRPRYAAGGLVVSYPKMYDFISIFDPAGIAAAVKSNQKTALKLPFRRFV